MSTLTEKDIVINILQDGLNINLRDTKSAYEYVKKAIREKRFVQKVQRMVKDVECGEPLDKNEKS